jgi:hypothetical protein
LSVGEVDFSVLKHEKVFFFSLPPAYKHHLFEDDDTLF